MVELKRNVTRMRGRGIPGISFENEETKLGITNLYSDKKEDVLFFLKLFRNLLSEMVGKEIITLGEASKYIDRKVLIRKYERDL